MIVLGVDPGIATTGYGLVDCMPGESPALLQFGTIRTPADMAMPHRLRAVFDGMNEILARWRPGELAIEELFFGRNVTNGLAVGQARGVILLSAALAGLGVFEYKPAQVKQSLVGYGNADKHQVQEMLRLTLELECVPKPDDASDAIAVAICHCFHERLRRLID
jgi:crossover junction endodeoxyribonuclease RuvC